LKLAVVLCCRTAGYIDKPLQGISTAFVGLNFVVPKPWVPFLLHRCFHVQYNTHTSHVPSGTPSASDNSLSVLTLFAIRMSAIFGTYS
jgi:hypothetical protein